MSGDQNSLSGDKKKLAEWWLGPLPTSVGRALHLEAVQDPHALRHKEHLQ